MSEFDTSITAYFGGDTSGLAKSVGEAKDHVEKLADKVGDKLYGTRDVANALATALGVNIEKIAEHIARLAIGMSKETEEGMKHAAELSDKLTELVIKNGQARLDDEQRYQLAIQKRDKLQKELDEGAGKGAKAQEEFTEKRIEQEQAISEIIAYETKQEKDRTDALARTVSAMGAAGEKQTAAYNDSLTAEKRIAALKDEIAVKQTAINQGLFTGKQIEEQRGYLDDLKLSLTKAQNEQHKEQNDLLKKGALSEQDRLFMFQYEHRLLLTVTDADVRRYEILKLQTKEKRDEAEIADLMEKSITGKLTPAEETRLKVLIKETQEIEKQIGLIKDAVPAVHAVTQEVNSLASAWNGMQVSVKGSNFGGFVEQSSTAALGGLIQKLQSQLAAPGRSGRPIDQADINQDYGDFATASALRGQLQTAQAEMTLRNKIVAFDKQFGDSATIAQFGDAATSRALQGFVSEQQKTNTVLQNISSKINDIFGG